MPIRRAVTHPLAACVALAALLTLSGCELVEDARARDEPTGSTSQGSHQPPTSDRPTAQARPKARTSTVEVDGVVLRITSRKPAVVQPHEESPDARTVDVTLPPGDTARLELASPGTLDVDADGSVAVLDADELPVAAMSPPAPPSGASDEEPRVEVEAVDDTHAELSVDQPRAADGAGDENRQKVQLTFVVGTQAIESATWGENEGGRSLAVAPTGWARHAGDAGLDLIRTQLVAAEPDADSKTMEDQLVCHAVGAPDKTTWNLEPWRPEVGLILTATAHCNPV